jgi:hypothetical protein
VEEMFCFEAGVVTATGIAPGLNRTSLLMNSAKRVFNQMRNKDATVYILVTNLFSTTCVKSDYEACFSFRGEFLKTIINPISGVKTTDQINPTRKPRLYCLLSIPTTIDPNI